MTKLSSHIRRLVAVFLLAARRAFASRFAPLRSRFAPPWRALGEALVELAVLTAVFLAMQVSCFESLSDAKVFEPLARTGSGPGNVVLLFALYAVLRGLLGSAPVALGIFVLGAFAVIAINRTKLTLVGLPLVPADVVMVSQWPLLVHYTPWEVVAAAVSAPLLLVVARLRRRWRGARGETPRRMSSRHRCVYLSFALLPVYLLTAREQLIPRSFKGLVARRDAFDPINFALLNGFPGMWLQHLRYRRVPVPPGYSRSAVEAVLSREPASLPETPAVRPHVVVVMMESVFDPRKLGLRFEHDPLATFRKLQSEGAGADIITPSFGGYTANVEFEVLSGLSTRYIPPGSAAFQHLLHRPIPSLARDFKSAGYRSVAMHNFTPSAWRRGQVYPLLGFDEFLSIKELGLAKGHGRRWPGDEVLLRGLENVLRAAREPVFAWLVTVATHGPYGGGTAYIDLQSPKVSNLGLLSALESYAGRVAEADRVLGEIARLLATLDRPSLLVAFGDHLPAIGTRDTTFLELATAAGVIPSRQSASPFLTRTTPLLVWATPGPARTRIRRRAPARLSTNFLGNDLLAWAGVASRDPLRAWLEQTRARYPVFNARGAEDREGRWQRAEEPGYHLVTYDRLLGEQFSVTPSALGR